MMPRFGLAPLGFLDVPPLEFITLAAAAGFASVNLRTAPAVPGGAAFPMRAGDDLVRACRRRLAETGISLRAIEQVGLGRATDVTSLRPMLEAGAELGASRILCSGDDPDFSLLADRFAELCRLAGQFGMAVDLEFMPFRALKTLTAAAAVVTASGAENGCVCLDALHLFRSGGSVASLGAVDPARLGPLQLCDAPRAAPAADGLAAEARERRQLALAELVAAYPDGRPIDAEIPMPGALDAGARARLIAEAMRTFLGARCAPLRSPGAGASGPGLAD
jgi:sugar phosphate isomerase/epimerase